MAAKVNTKFVLMLTAAVVVAVGAVFGAMYFFLHNTGADLARMGDKKMAAKQYEDAAGIYSKAVNKEKTNVAFLNKWIDALKHLTPDTQRKYGETFFQQLVAAQRQIANLTDDPAVARQYLTLRLELSEALPFERDGYEQIVEDTTTVLSRFSAPAPATESLRRFRGIARLRIAMNTPDIAKDLLPGVKEDLDAAIAADPADSDAVQGLATWHAVQASIAVRANDLATAKTEQTASRTVMSQFSAKNPQDAASAIIVQRQELEAHMREIGERTPKPGTEEIRTAYMDYAAATKPTLNAIASTAVAHAADVTPRAIGMLRDLEATIDPEAKLSRTESVLRAAIAAKPEDALLPMMMADVIAGRGDQPEAIAAFQKVIDQPIAPLSVMGYLQFFKRNEAMFRQSQSYFKAWQQAKDDKERAAAEVKIKDLRERMGASQDAGTPVMLLTDAELGLIANDLNKADRLLAQFNKATNNGSSEGLMLAADVAMRRAEPGAAKQRYEEVLQIDRTNMTAAARLAAVEAQMGNYTRSRELFEKLKEINPDNKYISDQLQQLSGITQGTKVDDPILQAVLEADRMNKELGKDPEAAAKVAAFLESEAKRLKATDPRMVRAQVLAYMRANNRPAAITAVQEGLKANPDSIDLQNMLIGLTESDPVKAKIAVIDQRVGQDEAERLVLHYGVYSDAGMKAEALAALAEAVKVAPNDKRVLETQCMQAMADKDWTLADTLTQRAEKEDLDGAGGATYRARLEAAKGNAAEGVRVMEQAVAKGGASPEMWRLLGRLQNGMGRNADAANSFGEALKRRPNDIPGIKDLLRTQIALGRTQDALNTARSKATFAESDAEFVDMWLRLESTAGDRAMVIDRRARLYKLNPADMSNVQDLAALYMDTDQQALARPLIDDLRKKSDGIAAVNLDAGWHWGQKDQAKAKKVFEDYIAASDANKSDPRVYAAYAQFLMQRQDVPGGLAVLERARAVQSTKTLDVDRILADTYFNMGKMEETIAAAKRVVDGNADTPNNLYRKRTVESLSALGRFQEADEALRPLLTADADAITKLLEAQVRGGLKDEAGQRRALDEAVAKFPNEATVFFKRGQTMLESSSDRASLRDAIADFTKALELNPQMWQVLRLRATAHENISRMAQSEDEKRKETEDSIADLRAALTINPYDNDLLSAMLLYLLQNNRDTDATEVANSAIEKRSQDVVVYMGVSRVFAEAGRWDQAVRYVERAFAIDPQDAVAQRYIDTLLSATPPRTSAAEQLLAGPLKARVAGNPSFLMAQARIQTLQDKGTLALRSARDALAALYAKDPAMAGAWYTEVRRMLPDPKAQRKFLEDMAQSGVATEWLALFRANLLLEETSGRDQGLAILRDLRQRSTVKPLRQLVFRSLGGSLYNFGQYVEAAEVMKAGLDEFPQDAESRNNLAYTLAKRLNKPEEGLPLAEQVVKERPASGDALDTLAVCHLALGKPEDALKELNTAAGLQMSPASAISVALHQAEALLAMNRREDAQKAFASATKVAERNTKSVPSQTLADLEDMKKRIEAP